MKTAITVAFVLFGLTVVAQERLTIKGSDTINAILMPHLVKAYIDAGNNVDFEIEHKGSSSAFTSLLAGTAEIGASSRAVRDSEKEKFSARRKVLVEREAAIDMTAVIVNERNRLEDLSLEQIEGIFTGDLTDWSEVGGRPGKINLYIRNNISGTFDVFRKLALAARQYSPDSNIMEGNSQIATAVAADRNGIGYVGRAYSEVEGVKTLLVNGISYENENQDTYPIARKLYYYTVGEPTGVVKHFLDWATTSEQAAKVITDTGFIPAK